MKHPRVLNCGCERRGDQATAEARTAGIRGRLLRGDIQVAASHPSIGLPPGYSGARTLGTAIYYLLTPDTCSRMHRLPGDEIFHFYLGDSVEMLQLWPDGSGEVIVLGDDLRGGMKPQHVVPAGYWQGSRVRPGGRFALLGTTMAPGFEREDYENGERADLLHSYPAFADLIVQLTPL